jgi:hypothetical protein
VSVSPVFDNDERADVRHAHALGRVDNHLAPGRDNDVAVADISNGHKRLLRTAGPVRPSELDVIDPCNAVATGD